MHSLRRLTDVSILFTIFLSASLVAAQSGGSVFANSSGPIILGNEGPLVPGNYSNPLFNDYGFVIRGNSTSGEEFHLWMFMYRQIGVSEYVVPAADVQQTSMIYGKFSTNEKAIMSDTSFINMGQDLEDYHQLGTLKTNTTKNQVTYDFEGRTYVSEPGKWRVTGTHANVTVDLELVQRGDEFYHAGRFSELKGCSYETTATNYNCSGVGGGIVHVYASGHINANGTRLTIDSAQGVHERIIQAYEIPPRLDVGLGRGSFWLHGWSASFSFFSFTADTGPYAVGLVNLGNKTSVISGTDKVAIEQTGQWLDPKTYQVNPGGWHTFIQLENGRLEADVQPFGRLYYYWLRNGGLLLVNQYIADAVITYTPENGTVVTEHATAFLEYMKTVYLQPK